MRVHAMDLAALIKRSQLTLIFLSLCILLAFLSDRFFTAANMLNVFRYASINGIIAVGMTMVILTAGIDLSVGAILAFSSVITAWFLVSGYVPLLAAAAGLVVGAVLGFINGILVARFLLPPFIATLGSMTFIRGLTLSFTQGRPITGLPAVFRTMGTGRLGPVPLPVIIMLLVFTVGAILLRLTAHGERLYALGSNPVAARFSGIPVNRYIVAVYCCAGLLAALAGQILIGRLDSAQPVMGMGYEFDAIAAVVIGGTSFSGGRGGLTGTLVGVLIIAVINNGLNLLNVPSVWEQVVKGLVIAAALLANRPSSTGK